MQSLKNYNKLQIYFADVNEKKKSVNHETFECFISRHFYFLRYTYAFPSILKISGKMVFVEPGIEIIMPFRTRNTRKKFLNEKIRSVKNYKRVIED